MAERGRDTGFIAVQPPSGGLQDVKDWVFEQMVRLAMFNQQYREAVSSRNYPKYRSEMKPAMALLNSTDFASATYSPEFAGMAVVFPAVASACASPAVVSVNTMGEDWEQESTVVPVMVFSNAGSASGTSIWQLTSYWTNDGEKYSAGPTQSATYVLSGTADKLHTLQFGPITGDGKRVNSQLCFTISRLPDTPASALHVTQVGYKGRFDASGSNNEDGK